jgi:hypothetical protein
MPGASIIRALLTALRAALRGRMSPNQRTLRLLRENLTPQQRHQYETYGHFDVLGGDTGHRYRIRRSSMLNVDEFDSTGQCISRWCFLPKGNLPPSDVLLAQKIALELFESETRTIANLYPAHHPVPARASIPRLVTLHSS